MPANFDEDDLSDEEIMVSRISTTLTTPTHIATLKDKKAPRLRASDMLNFSMNSSRHLNEHIDSTVDYSLDIGFQLKTGECECNEALVVDDDAFNILSLKAMLKA